MEPVKDGNLNFSGGQNSSIDPLWIEENQYAAGVNVSVSRGSLGPRWANHEVDIFFSGSVKLGGARSITYEEIFRFARFQALIPYTYSGERFLIIVVSGYAYLISLRSKDILLLGEGQLINPNLKRVNWSPAGRFLVIFDFPNYPFIVEGLTIRRANPAEYEVLRSRLGTHNQNRLFIANGGNEFTAGDPAGSAATPNAPITFEEVIINNADFVGDVYQLPTSGQAQEEITAMGFLQVTDGSTQIGPLLVATENTISSFPTQLPRDQWLAGQFGTLLVYNAGIPGQRCFVNINGDIHFISSDSQIRTLSMSRDEQKRWSNTPISGEVKNWTKDRFPELAKYGACTYFKNKAFFAVNPFRTTAITIDNRKTSDVAFGGMVVLELDNQARLLKQPDPVWAGLWTGMRPMEMCVIGERMFVMSKDEMTRNVLYEVRPDKSYDVVRGKRKRIKSIIYTRSYTCGDRTIVKEIKNLDMSIKDLSGDTEIKLEYKAEHVGKFLPWQEFKHCAEIIQTRFPLIFPEVIKHTIRDINFGSVDTTTGNLVDGTPAALFEAVQLRITILANDWKLSALKLSAIPHVTEEINLDSNNECVQVPADKDIDWEVDYYNE